MLKFIRLFKNYYFGISFIGIAAFVIQEIPYIVMPLIKPASNPIMNMQNEIKWIASVQGIFGMLSMILLMLIVRDDVKLIPIETVKEKTSDCRQRWLRKRLSATIFVFLTVFSMQLPFSKIIGQIKALLSPFFVAFLPVFSNSGMHMSAQLSFPFGLYHTSVCI